MTIRLKLFVILTSSFLVLFLLMGSVMGGDGSPEAVLRHLGVFSEVLAKIKTDYVEEPDIKDVTLGALNGLLEQVDPYASYLDKGQYEHYKENLKGETADVGLVLSRKSGYVSVVDSIPGSPADRAGLTTYDMIETLGGVATRDMPLAFAELLLRGKAGTKVKLTVLRLQNGTEPQEFTLTREKVSTPPVRSEMAPDNIGVIRVRSLETGKADDIARQIKRLTDDGAQRFILDLRRVTQGDPAEGLAVADLFLDEGLMSYVEGQKVARKEFRASRDKTVTRLPMVVVINRGSANGAEVATAALLDNKRAPVVGEPSYGDASIRQAVPLRDGGAVILSVAKYYTPGGKPIQDGQGGGIRPTVAAYAQEPVLPEGEVVRIGPRPEKSLADDELLQKAIEVLKNGPSNVTQDAEQPELVAP